MKTIADVLESIKQNDCAPEKPQCSSTGFWINGHFCCFNHYAVIDKRNRADALDKTFVQPVRDVR